MDMMADRHELECTSPCPDPVTLSNLTPPCLNFRINKRVLAIGTMAEFVIIQEYAVWHVIGTQRILFCFSILSHLNNFKLNTNGIFFCGQDNMLSDW